MSQKTKNDRFWESSGSKKKVEVSTGSPYITDHFYIKILRSCAVFSDTVIHTNTHTHPINDNLINYNLEVTRSKQMSEI